jgi:uncharacterized protein (DUF1499 family)
MKIEQFLKLHFFTFLIVFILDITNVFSQNPNVLNVGDITNGPGFSLDASWSYPFFNIFAPTAYPYSTIHFSVPGTYGWHQIDFREGTNGYMKFGFYPTGSTSFTMNNSGSVYIQGYSFNACGFNVAAGDATITGNLALGTSNDPSYRLSVCGKIRSTEVKVQAGWCDFVFEPSYRLKSLDEVESFVKTNKHLPDIPTAEEVKANGLELGEMTSKLLQKVEELTLYLIQQKKEIEQLKSENDSMKRSLEIK